MSDLTHVTLPSGAHALSWGTSGPPVVLVHGLDGSAANWVTVGSLLADGHRVLAPDLAGFGRTPARVAGGSMRAHADAVLEATRWFAGDEPAVLAGNSMGGVVALLAAATAPDRWSRLTLVASALPRAGTSRLDPTMLAAVAALWVPGAGIPVAGSRNATPPEQRVRALLDLCVAPGAQVPREAFDEMVAVAVDRPRRDHVRGWTRSARSLWPWLARRGAFHALADAVTAEAVLLTGAVDPIIPATSAAAFAARHPRWAHVDLPGVAHVPPLEAPSATADVIVGR